jgi:transposase-like protein
MKIYNDNGNELVLVLKDWLEYQEITGECPFCGSDNLVTKPQDETLEARRGCGDCNRWFEPALCRF